MTLNHNVARGQIIKRWKTAPVAVGSSLPPFSMGFEVIFEMLFHDFM